MIINIILLVLALIGLGICFYIGTKKIKGEQLVCSIDHHCTEVVNSKFGKTFGVENTLLGALYYGLVAVVSILKIFNLNIFGLENYMIYLALGSSLFSFYLLYIMFGVLKDRCDWCIGSAVVTNLITILYLLDHFKF